VLWSFCPAVAMILFAAVKFYRRELAGIEEASRRPTGPLAPGPALREEMVKSSGAIKILVGARRLIIGWGRI
jgi:hypothetical protein